MADAENKVFFDGHMNAVPWLVEGYRGHMSVAYEIPGGNLPTSPRARWMISPENARKLAMAFLAAADYVERDRMERRNG